MKLETLFAFSLIAGFFFSLLFVMTSGKLRFLHGKGMGSLHRIRLPRIKIPGKRFVTARNDASSPFAGPVLPGMFLTLFGFLGLVFRVLLKFSSGVSVGAALVFGLGASAILGSLANRYFAVSANEVRGKPLPGIIGRISLAIPEDGVGTVAYQSDGKRFTMPARDRNGQPLPKGTRVMVIDVQNHIALVDVV